MASKQARGTKRTCQNSECGSRFYDLDRDPIVCPICGSKYQIASSPMAIAAPAEKARKPKKAEFEPSAAPVEDAEEVETEEALAEAATEGEEEPAAAEADETFLEEEEESGDVSTIIGGPVAEGDEER